MRFSQFILLSVIALPMAWAADGAANTLTAAEKADGWQLLFDGKSLDQWRGYKKEGLPSGWKAQEDGTLARVGGGGDLISKEQFAVTAGFFTERPKRIMLFTNQRQKCRCLIIRNMATGKILKPVRGRITH